MRQAFVRELDHLQEELLVLGSMVESALIYSVECLWKRDFQGSRQIMAEDRRINERRFSLEASCLALIATQQPIAGDLRVIAAVLEIATELERIGDYAKGIGRINLLLGPAATIHPLPELTQMAEKACEMLRLALDAFVREDVEASRRLPKQDDVVDALYNQVFASLIQQVLADPQPCVIERSNYLLWAAHNLERAADRVSNICERTVFMATGEFGELADDAED